MIAVVCICYCLVNGVCLGSTQLGLAPVAEVRGSELTGFCKSEDSVRKGASPFGRRSGGGPSQQP